VGVGQQPSSEQETEVRRDRPPAPHGREAGVLVTLDAQNNFPQLPIRTDGSYLVWLGIASDNEKLKTAFTPLVERSSKSLFATDLLRAEPEIVILDPAKRSRLRWIADDPK
jgi:hypothetical protein